MGTAYRQRSQILVFYFIFVAVGAILLKERQEDRRRSAFIEKQMRFRRVSKEEARQRYAHWKDEHAQELERVAQGITERINF